MDHSREKNRWGWDGDGTKSPLLTPVLERTLCNTNPLPQFDLGPTHLYSYLYYEDLVFSLVHQIFYRIRIN